MTDGGVQNERIPTTEEEASEGQRETRGTQRGERRRSEAAGETGGPGGQLTCSGGAADADRTDNQEWEFSYCCLGKRKKKKQNKFSVKVNFQAKCHDLQVQSHDLQILTLKEEENAHFISIPISLPLEVSNFNVSVIFFFKSHFNLASLILNQNLFFL